MIGEAATHGSAARVRRAARRGRAAQAHNILISSDPKDGAQLATGPGKITLTFDQPVRQGFAQISVTGPDGTRWENGTTTVDSHRVSVGVNPWAPRASTSWATGSCPPTATPSRARRPSP
ncbi:copper resistance protein CopC [Streptosporangium lutulentum]